MVGIKINRLIMRKYCPGSITAPLNPMASPKLGEVSLIKTIEPKMSPSCCIMVCKKLNF